MEVASYLGLTGSYFKSKFMASGTGVSQDERRSLAADNGLIECVDLPWISDCD